ncbi:MAG: Unknown protein [uncultured Sulfurovum sp.]|uniref:Uncharacterized protein n=1 Tax=uncultured Sulfurovum sp. TaxID=269237 RepID=A0A6S6SAS5_9BACT|nr:MAG: Unknown protein [uncultured Sulfurovum sp.]
MKKTSLILLLLIVFLGCGENEKQKIIDVIQEINIKNDVEAKTLTELSSELSEVSGLVNIDGELWGHNDSGSKAELYLIDSSSGKILKTIKVSNASNVDWEDLTFDSTHLFIGDFGNNKGTRQDLKIYKISLNDLKTKTDVSAEVIEFSYANQTEFEQDTKTNYDCEAFVAYDTKLYLFSKNYGDEKTNRYVLSKEKGTQVAEKVDTYDTNSLVTGASMDNENKTLVLIGYSDEGTPKTWIFSDFVDMNFFEGRQQRFSWGTPIKAQIEGVTHMGKGKLYISSEKYNYTNSLGSFTLNQSLYELNY